MHRERTEEELRDAVSRFCNGKSVMSIPVNRERDADKILLDGIEELAIRRKEQEALRVVAPESPYLQEYLQDMGLRVTDELVIMPKWMADYLCDSTRHHALLFDLIRTAYRGATVPALPDHGYRQLDILEELERRGKAPWAAPPSTKGGE
jgi:hypothetical protein